MIKLPNSSKTTLLKMLGDQHEAHQILVVGDGTEEPTAWVLSGKRSFLGRMPVPTAMQMFAHEQPWIRKGKDWLPTPDFEWEDTDRVSVKDMLDRWANWSWDTEIHASHSLYDSDMWGLCRVFTSDDLKYWIAQELFVKCVLLLTDKPNWHVMDLDPRMIRASKGWGEHVEPIAYFMPLSDFVPIPALAEAEFSSAI